MLSEIDKQLAQLSRRANRLVRAALHAAGFYRSRGEWKRRRRVDQPIEPEMATSLLVEQLSTWAEVGTLAQSIERACIGLIPGQDRRHIEDTEQRLAFWRAELTAGSRSPIDRAHVDCIVVTSYL